VLNCPLGVIGALPVIKLKLLLGLRRYLPCGRYPAKAGSSLHFDLLLRALFSFAVIGGY